MDPTDGGFASRKFLFCVCVAGVIVAIGLLGGTVLPGVADLLTVIYGGLLGISGLYLTGNISNNYLAAKAAATTPAKPSAKPVAGQKPSQPVVAPEESS